MRLGDLDELLEVMNAFEPIVQGRHDGIGLVEHGTWAGLCEIVKDAPTIDAVPVVRCKDCKHWLKDVAGCTDNVGRCEWANWMVGAVGYCVYGERKDGEGL